MRSVYWPSAVVLFRRDICMSVMSKERKIDNRQEAISKQICTFIGLSLSSLCETNIKVSQWKGHRFQLFLSSRQIAAAEIRLKSEWEISNSRSH